MQGNPTSRPLRILYGFAYFPTRSADPKQLFLAHVRRLQEAGFDVEPFCLTLDPPAQAMTFRELDWRWRLKDKILLTLYENLAFKLSDYDVLLNGNGINLHPAFIEQLSVFTVFQCFDDPENSHNLSKPVVHAYDLCLVGNVAEVDNYRRWGAQAAEWTTLSLEPGFYGETLTYDEVLHGQRDIDLFMMIDRLAPWNGRRQRLDKLAAAFPMAHFYGQGWDKGFLPVEEQLRLMRRAKIGPNVHNSTGPLNSRTFYTPANGMMQICDNKSHLGKLFELGTEAVGFDNIEEGVELCRYYLTHDEERQQIAANGWRRAVTDYNEINVFKRRVELIESQMRRSNKGLRRLNLPVSTARQDPLVRVATTAARLTACIDTAMRDPQGTFYRMQQRLG